MKTLRRVERVLVATALGAALFDPRSDAVAKPLRSGTSFVVTYTLADQDRSAVGMDRIGAFVVVWTSYRQEDPVGDGIFAQRFDQVGRRVGGEFQVNTYTPQIQTTPAVAAGAEKRPPARRPVRNGVLRVFEPN